MLPSTTEILFALGAGHDVVGVTFECNFPPQARTRRIVSTSALTEGLNPNQIDAEVRARLGAGEDLYHLDQDALRDLAPDLIVTQDLCAVCAVDVTTVEAALDHLGCEANVLTVDPSTLLDVLDSITTIGVATDRVEAARRLVSDLQTRLEQVVSAVAGQARPRVAVLEWTDPLFSAGHWVPDMVDVAGAVSALGASGDRSYPISPDTLAASGADIIVVAPCGYDLAGATRLATEIIENATLPGAVPVWAVDADAVFVRPGPRLVDGIEALAAICHPRHVAARPDLAAPVRDPASP